MLLLITIGPVSHIPRGTMRCPPPSAASLSIARANACVHNAVPLPTAPKSVTDTDLSGNVGALISGMSNGMLPLPLPSLFPCACAPAAVNVSRSAMIPMIFLISIRIK